MRISNINRYLLRINLESVLQASKLSNSLGVCILYATFSVLMMKVKVSVNLN